MIDFIVFILFLVAGLIGYHRGFVKSVLGLIGMILAFIFANIFKVQIGSQILGNNFYDDTLSGIIDDTSVSNMIIEYVGLFIGVTFFYIIFRVVAFVIRREYKDYFSKLDKNKNLKIVAILMAIIGMHFIIAPSVTLAAQPIFNIKSVSSSFYGQFVTKIDPVFSGIYRGIDRMVENGAEIYEKIKNGNIMEMTVGEAMDTVIMFESMNMDLDGLKNDLINSDKIDAEMKQEIEKLDISFLKDKINELKNSSEFNNENIDELSLKEFFTIINE